MEILEEKDLQQLKTKPTRLSAVLDLFCINKPDLVKDISIIPGMSDHETVVVDTFLKIPLNKMKPRHIRRWSKADWDSLRDDTVEFQKLYFDKSTDHTVDENYNCLLGFIKFIMDNYVHQKLSSTRRNVPWFTPCLRRMCGTKQRLYNKARKSGTTQNWNKFKQFQKSVIKAMRAARWDYINGILHAYI